MEELLQPVDTTHSLFLYRDTEKLTCSDYDKLHELLAESLFEPTLTDKKLMIDWTYTPTHPLIFECCMTGKTEANVFDFWMRYFDLVFLPTFQKYVDIPELTFLLALPYSSASGLRIHVVDIELSHDDYDYVCHLMQKECTYKEEDLSVHLDCPSQFPLPSCHRPEETGIFYKPVRLVRVRFGFYQKNGVWKSRHFENVTLEQSKENSFFDKIVNHESRWKEMARSMTPVPGKNPTYLHFPEHIKAGWHFKERVLFRSLLNEQQYTIVKGKVLKEGPSLTYEFFKNNSPHIELTAPRKRDPPIELFSPRKTISDMAIFEIWYNRFQNRTSPLKYFHSIDYQLRIRCPHLKDEKSPLETVLRAYECPVYYALHNISKEFDKIHEQFPFLSKDLPSVPPKEASHLTFDTILYCAYLTGEGTLTSHIGMGFDWIVKTITSVEELVKHVRWVQQKAFPVMRTLTKTYAWNPDNQKWQALENPVIEIQDYLRWSLELLNMYSELSPNLMNSFLEENCIETVARAVHTESREQTKEEQIYLPEMSETYGQVVPEYYFVTPSEKTTVSSILPPPIIQVIE